MDVQQEHAGKNAFKIIPQILLSPSTHSQTDHRRYQVLPQMSCLPAETCDEIPPLVEYLYPLALAHANTVICALSLEFIA